MTTTDELMRLVDLTVADGEPLHTNEYYAALRTAIQEVVEWIPVDARLPEPNTPCLVLWMIGNELRPAISSLSVKWKGMWLWHGHLGSHNDVTHWMPLPPPPAIRNTASRSGG